MHELLCKQSAIFFRGINQGLERKQHDKKKKTSTDLHDVPREPMTEAEVHRGMHSCVQVFTFPTPAAAVRQVWGREAPEQPTLFPTPCLVALGFSSVWFLPSSFFPLRHFVVPPCYKKTAERVAGLGAGALGQRQLRSSTIWGRVTGGG